MAKLNFRKLGEGEPLIIMHGLYGSSDNWVSIARELMTNFSVYIIDMRNHGASPHLPDHNYQVMTNDLIEFMNENEIYSSIILGHSMGGKVAMFFTAMNPERVKKLVIVDISPRSYNLEKGDNQVTHHEQILDGLSSINLANIENRVQVDDALAQTIESQRIRQFLLKNLRRNRDGSYHWKINIDVLKQNLPSVLIGLEDEKEELNIYSNPTLFIKGENSDYINTTDEKMIKEYFSKSKIITINNASHWVHAEKPDEFIKAVKEFVLT